MVSVRRLFVIGTLLILDAAILNNTISNSQYFIRGKYKNSVFPINIFAVCYSTRPRAYTFENYNQINIGLVRE